MEASHELDKFPFQGKKSAFHNLEKVNTARPFSAEQYPNRCLVPDSARHDDGGLLEENRLGHHGRKKERNGQKAAKLLLQL